MKKLLILLNIVFCIAFVFGLDQVSANLFEYTDLKPQKIENAYFDSELYTVVLYNKSRLDFINHEKNEIKTFNGFVKDFHLVGYEFAEIFIETTNGFYTSENLINFYDILAGNIEVVEFAYFDTGYYAFIYFNENSLYLYTEYDFTPQSFKLTNGDYEDVNLRFDSVDDNTIIHGYYIDEFSQLNLFTVLNESLNILSIPNAYSLKEVFYFSAFNNIQLYLNRNESPSEYWQFSLQKLGWNQELLVSNSYLIPIFKDNQIVPIQVPKGENEEFILGVNDSCRLRGDRLLSFGRFIDSKGKKINMYTYDFLNNSWDQRSFSKVQDVNINSFEGIPFGIIQKDQNQFMFKYFGNFPYFEKYTYSFPERQKPDVILFGKNFIIYKQRNNSYLWSVESSKTLEIEIISIIDDYALVFSPLTNSYIWFN